MAASVFAHSSKSLMGNINTNQWELNEHSQLKKKRKKRNPHTGCTCEKPVTLDTQPSCDG